MRGLNLSSLLNSPSGNALHGLAFNEEVCAPHRHRLSSCKACIEACPTGAISRQGRITIAPALCMGCGICAAACPVGAIEAQAPTNSDLLRRVRKLLANSSAVAFICPHSGPKANAGAAVEVPCLGRLDESILVGSVALGATTIWLVHGDCGGCALTRGRSLLDPVVANAQSLLACLGADGDIRCVSALPPGIASQTRSDSAGATLSRRELLTSFAGQVRESEWWNIDPVIPASPQPGPGAKGAAPPRASTKQRLLVASARRLGEPLPGATLTAFTARFHTTAACTGCQMCALFCPTGALSKTRKGEQVGLTFQASLCTNCGLCREICFWNAVELTPGCNAALWVHESIEAIWFAPVRSPQP